jgi:hypothetical protein
MQKKAKNNKSFSFKSIDDITDVHYALIDIENKYPIVMKFLEEYCGYNTAVLSPEPNEICYSQGKRDVILTIKTLMRKDIDAKQIAEYYNKI